MVRRCARALATTSACCALLAVAVACGDQTGPVVRRASGLMVVSGDDQEAEVGSRLPAPIVVRAIDSTGAPVGGVTVNFDLVPEHNGKPDGSLDASTAVTGRDGLASVRWTLSTIATWHGLRAWMIPEGAAEPVVVFAEAKARAGIAVSLDAYSAQDVGMTVGLMARIGVVGRDRYGNPTPTFAGFSWYVPEQGAAAISGFESQTDLIPAQLATLATRFVGRTAIEARDIAAGTIRFDIRVYGALARPIAFAMTEGVSIPPGIYVTPPGGVTPTHLLAGQLFDPAWSPDGGRIAFSGPPIGGIGPSTIQVMNADGSGVHALTAATHPGGELRPAWSPDGSKIAFVARLPTDSGGGTDTPAALYVMNADGSGETRVAMPSPPDCGSSRFRCRGPGTAQPAWSPDGRRVAFSFEWRRPVASPPCHPSTSSMPTAQVYVN
jgi:hypothetical protein